jgi:hypothetical protein
MFSRAQKRPGISPMSMDQNYEAHLQTWLGFGRLMRWVVGLVILTLAGMAYFLL